MCFFISGCSRIRTHVLVHSMRTSYRCANIGLTFLKSTISNYSKQCHIFYRIAQKQMHLVDGKVVQVNLVERESDNTTYIFYPASKHCYKFPAQKITNCISPELKYTIGLKLGINPALDVDVYTLAVTNRTFTYINLSVTKNDCVPIGQTIVRALSREVWGSQTESFYDLALGIKDTSVFDVPSYCQKVAVRPLSGLTHKAHTAYYHRRAPFL